MENLFHKINKKHPSIKFYSKYSISDFEFIDVLVHKDEQKRLQTTRFKKKTNRQSYLHATSDHLASFKKKYSVQSNTACQKLFSTNSEFERNCTVLLEQFTKRGYDSSFIVTNNKKIKLLDRKTLLTPKTTQKAQVLLRAVIYNRTLPNIKQIIQNDCLILIANKFLQKAFSIKPLLAFRKNES